MTNAAAANLLLTEAEVRAICLEANAKAWDAETIMAEFANTVATNVVAAADKANNLCDAYAEQVRLGLIAAAAAAPVEPGMYRNAAGQVYRVVVGKESGNLYAKALKIANGKAYFEYAYGAIKGLTANDRMTLDEAKALGLETGICCVCSATLTDPKSIAAGIGPVCAKRV